MRPTWTLVIVVSGVLAIVGCCATSKTASAPLVGIWITSDITQVGHIPGDTVAMTMEFKANGAYESFFLDKDGESTPAIGYEPLQWTTKNNMLLLGDAPPIEYELTGTKLRLIVTDDQENKLTLRFTRQ